MSVPVMKERPILFSAPMIRAILEGRKSQTRRVMKGDYRYPCPYGGTGDRLWVREALRRNTETNKWEYAADGDVVSLPGGHPSGAAMIGWAHHKEGDVCVSIHMPRWASRITLEITGVRVERVQDISEADAMAEGVGGIRDMQFAVALGNLHAPAHRLNYIDLWNEINGPGSWAANPWVWVLTFKRAEGGAA
jgi:hypothetical protein